MLTVYEAMDKRAADLTRERERQLAARAEAERRQRQREERAVELVKEWVEATQDFTLDGMELGAFEVSRVNDDYRISIRFPDSDGAVEGYFCARPQDPVIFGFRRAYGRTGDYRFMAGDVVEDQDEHWHGFDELVDALAYAYHVGAGIPVSFDVEVTQ